MSVYEKPKTAEEARGKSKKAERFWIVYFAIVVFCTFFPGFYPANVVEPFILGIPVHLFKWFLCTIALIGGMVVFELTTWAKWRGDD